MDLHWVPSRSGSRSSRGRWVACGGTGSLPCDHWLPSLNPSPCRDGRGQTGTSFGAENHIGSAVPSQGRWRFPECGFRGELPSQTEVPSSAGGRTGLEGLWEVAGIAPPIEPLLPGRAHPWKVAACPHVSFGPAVNCRAPPPPPPLATVLTHRHDMASRATSPGVSAEMRYMDCVGRTGQRREESGMVGRGPSSRSSGGGRYFEMGGQSYLSRDSPINQPKREMYFSR